MSSTAAVVPSVAYHLPKRPIKVFPSQSPVNNSSTCTNSTNSITDIKTTGSREFKSVPELKNSDSPVISLRPSSGCFDNALRNSLKPWALGISRDDCHTTGVQTVSERLLSFHESSAPPLDTVIRKRIEAFPQSLILTDTQTKPLSSPSRSDIILCNHSELESLCRLGSQYVPRQPLGLGNSGNTCYLNSVLQCVLATGPLLAFIGTRHSSPNACKTSSGQLPSVSLSVNKSRFCGLCGIFRLLTEHSQLANGITSNYSMGRHIVPSYFVGNVRAICPNLRPYQQEDAHEFLLGLLSRMEDNTMAGLGKLPRSVAETNVIRRIFGGVVRSEVTCHFCRNVSARDEQCFNLSVDITCGRSLQQCLFNYIRPEELSGQNAYKCEKCRQLRAAMRRSTIFQGAPILIIQFNRFSRSHKLDHRIEFPSSFNLRPFMTDNKGPPVLYRLYATVNHEGYSCRSGHYVAFTRRNGTWYSHNDSFVNSTHPDHVLRQSPYLLFYEAVNPTRQPSANETSFNDSKSAEAQLSIPVDQIPLPNYVPCTTAKESSVMQRVTDSVVVTSKQPTQTHTVSSAPRIVFNPNVSRPRNNGSQSLNSQTSSALSSRSSPVKPVVRQLLYGSNDVPGLWTEKPTPSSNSHHIVPSPCSGSDNHNGNTETVFHNFHSGKRKHSPTGISDKNCDSRKHTSSKGEETEYFSVNGTRSDSSVHSSPRKRSRTGDSDSSIEWVPLTRKDLSRESHSHASRDSKHHNGHKKHSSSEASRVNFRFMDGYRSSDQHHKHHRKRHRDRHDKHMHHKRSHKNFQKHIWHRHHNFHRK